MSPQELALVGPGFADPVLDSQAVFRGCLCALARPGSVVDLAGGERPVDGLRAAAGSLLRALLDQDTRLWVSPGAPRCAATHLRFHTGCALVDAPGEADFALVAAPEELPALATFNAGSDEYPDRSASVVLQVPRLAEGGPWRLSGPGIRGEARLAVTGLGTEFVAQWEANRRRFPRGVDLYLASGTRLCGLPRTTRIEH
jgi:alpha-D-ribose 1-methylphosphonate 5-triphosphate synthase subunit PhnH